MYRTDNSKVIMIHILLHVVVTTVLHRNNTSYYVELAGSREKSTFIYRGIITKKGLRLRTWEEGNKMGQRNQNYFSGCCQKAQKIKIKRKKQGMTFETGTQ